MYISHIYYTEPVLLLKLGGGQLPHRFWNVADRDRLAHCATRLWLRVWVGGVQGPARVKRDVSGPQVRPSIDEVALFDVLRRVY